ncbi:MAG: PIN domain-containing protein [Chloroflexi bacterium]|nr:PIN domain-containing protein [Chloroflexota bacterium]
MIAVDTNLLVYAHRREFPWRPEASRLLRSLSEGEVAWAIPWPCCYEFLSVVTNRRIWKDAASTPQEAWRQLLAWTAAPSARLIGETEGFLDILRRFVQQPRVTGGVVHDARIAAICVAHGVDALLTLDRDFSLFPELHTRNPIGVR